MSIIFTVSTLLSSSLFKHALMYSSSLIFPSLSSSISFKRASAVSSSVSYVTYERLWFIKPNNLRHCLTLALSNPCISVTNFAISDFEIKPSL